MKTFVAEMVFTVQNMEVEAETEEEAKNLLRRVRSLFELEEVASWPGAVSKEVHVLREKDQ